MGDKRKLLGEVERGVKKVQEGVDSYDETYSKWTLSTNSSHKDKLENDLKKDIKKLQRLRDQIKNWISSNDVKDKSSLMDARKKIETRMEKYKEFERDSKNKSTIPGSEPSKSTSSRKKSENSSNARNDCVYYLSEKISDIRLELHSIETEMEKLNVTQRSKKHEKEKQHLLEQNNKYVGILLFHINNIEILIHRLEQDLCDPFLIVNKINDQLEYVIMHYKDVDFISDENMYGDIFYEKTSLDEEDVDSPEIQSPSKLVQQTPISESIRSEKYFSSNKSRIKSTSESDRSGVPTPMNSPIIPRKFSKPEERDVKPKVFSNPVAPKPVDFQSITTTSSTGGVTFGNPPISTSTDDRLISKSGRKPEQKASMPVKKPLNKEIKSSIPSDTNFRASNESSILLDKMSHSNLYSTPISSVRSDQIDEEANISEYCSHLTDSQAASFKRLNDSFKNRFPTSHVPHSKTLRVSRTPIKVPPQYIHETPKHLSTFEFYEKAPLETLIFIFYFYGGTRAQSMAANALKSRDWRFHTNNLCWYQRASEPMVITSDLEQGSYVYFDFEKWTKTVQDSFSFDFCFLEDKD